MRERLLAISPIGLVCFALLALATVGFYAQVLGFDFVGYDDSLFVVENQRVQAGLTADNFFWAMTAGDQSNWHPLTWLSHMLDVQLYGSDPAGHHATALLFHIVNTLLLFGILRAMTGSIAKSLLVAALFSLHPLHVESVAWVSARGNILSGFFGLLALGAYVSYTRGRKVVRPFGKTAIPTPCLVAVFFAMSLMAKPMWIMLPFLLLLLDYWPLGRLAEGPRALNPASGRPSVDARHSMLELVREKLPLWSVAIVASVITLAVQFRGGNMGTEGGMPLVLRLANGVVSYARYLGKTFWPSELSPLYPHPYIAGSGAEPWSALQLGGALALLAAISFAVVHLRSRRPYLLVGWLWFLGALLPAIGFFQVGLQAMADRYTYIPLIGLFVALAWGAGELARAMGRRGPVVVGVAMGLVVAVLGVHSYLQSQHWKDDYALRQHAVEITPNNSFMLVGLARNLVERGDERGAMRLYQRALEIHPGFGSAHTSLGKLHERRGNAPKALVHYREAVEIDPGNSTSQYALGAALAEHHRPSEAIQALRLALQGRFGESGGLGIADVHFLLGNTLHEQGALSQAVHHYRKVLSLAPERAGQARFWIDRALRDQKLVSRTPQIVRRSPTPASAPPQRF